MTLYTSNSNIKQLFSDLINTLMIYLNGFVQNKLSLNAGNTKYIIIKPKHRKVKQIYSSTTSLLQELEMTAKKKQPNLSVYYR